MFDKQDITRNQFMLTGSLAIKGYDWWWHSFTAKNEKTGEEKSFFIEFFVCNPALRKNKPILGQLTKNKIKNKRPSYLMVKAGCWGNDHCQLHKFFGINKVYIHDKAPYFIAAGNCFASDIRLKGSVCVTESESKNHPEYMCDFGTMEWDLKLDKKIAFNVGYGANDFFRAIKAFEMYWHAEGMKTLYSGTVTYNGEKYIVTPETSYGYADKNWGRDFTSPWIWLSSCNLKSSLTGKKLNNSVFDIGGGRPKVYCVPLDKKLLGAFMYEGKEYEYNFSKPWTMPKTIFYTKETSDKMIWHIRLENFNSVMITDIHCKKSDMLLINYEAPDGSKKHNCLWNGGNGEGRIRLYKKVCGKLKMIDDIRAYNVGCEYGVYDKI